jgi:hypothetical protein
MSNAPKVIRNPRTGKFMRRPTPLAMPVKNHPSLAKLATRYAVGRV